MLRVHLLDATRVLNTYILIGAGKIVLMSLTRRCKFKMSSLRLDQSSRNSDRSKGRINAQTTIDTRLQQNFEELRSSFDYSSAVQASSVPSGDPQPGSDGTTIAYLQHIQKGKLIQSFGCLLALDERTLKVIAHSENAPEMLTMASHEVPCVGGCPILGIGTDVRTIFTAPSASAIQKAVGFADVSLLNPILVHCKTSGRTFYAILHRVTGSLIVDFEPVKPHEVPMTVSGALLSHKLAAKAIDRLQVLPSGSIERLCDTMIQEVFELTGYDRVMAYKFHDDDHGEVIAEVTKPGLEPYLGLHYPATDIPQAARFLFMKNKVRMIVDCRAKRVKVLEDDKLSSDLTLCGSTLRAPQGCHPQYMMNMNSIASLVMAVVANEGRGDPESNGSSSEAASGKRKRLWGLLVCHNTSPRFVPYPLRYACEFLAQVFAIHVNKELEIENQIKEKNVFRIQTLLCDMLVRDAPLGITSRNPNVMDLVKCDGAALLYNNKIYRLGLTPTDLQIQDIVSWLAQHYSDSIGVSTDSLYRAGFHGALALGDAVCGMAAARITSEDMLFWFRSHTASQIRWGGAKHEPDEKDGDCRMHPRSSFNAFRQVVKMRSPPWKDTEMDAIHSLQLILRDVIQVRDAVEVSTKPRLQDLKIETATVPFLAVDKNGKINGWNSRIAEITGLPVDRAIGEHLLTLIEDSSTAAMEKIMSLALQEKQNIQFGVKTRGCKEAEGSIRLIANAFASRDLGENVVGVCFVAEDVTAQKIVVDKFTRLEGEYRAIIHSPNPRIPPLFGSNECGLCSEWNPAMEKLTGWNREEVMHKMLPGEVFGTHSACCRLKNRDALVSLKIVLKNAMAGDESEKVSFGFFVRNGMYVECQLSVAKKLDQEGAATGVFCLLQLSSQEMQQAACIHRMPEQTALKRLEILTYMKRQKLKGTNLGAEQKQLLQTSAQCQRQLNMVLDDPDFDSIIDGYLELEMAEFILRQVVFASVSQVMVKSSSKEIRIILDATENVMAETFYGDSLRLQQVLADFLSASVDYTSHGSVLVVSAELLTRDPLGETTHLARLVLRITHVGEGIPDSLLNQMFCSNRHDSEDVISLLFGRKLVKLMNGDVQYLREAGKSSLIIMVELALAHKP
ncbi:hypothetical protein SAY86_012146 [Trapa natans]|uniref:Phytochrome n=1 Tax=Trapa natans TaxID=22666 RepID=A0AAN7M9I6_TRANT|nr:hypothetical protein SAY86_012146 [Trapa natans]